MKFFKKPLAAISLLTASLLLFGACTINPVGGENSGDNPPEQTQPENPTPEKPEDTAVYAITALTNGCYLLADDESYSSAETSFRTRKNKVDDQAPEISYTIADPTVAEVDENGVVTAKAYGKTELIATYHGKTASVPISVFERTTAENVNSFDEAYVNRYGRQYFTDGLLNVDNVASGIEVAFLGSSLTVNVTVTQDVYVHTYIDGDTEGAFVRMTTGAFVLAEGLGEGIHTVRMLKASEGDRGKFTVSGFVADEFLRFPEKSDLKIEFIGDSITAGYGNLVTGGTWAIDNSDGCASYAALTGQKLGADFSVIALSGICLAKDVWGANINMKELHTYLSYRERTPYTYDADMDVVVLALGTNDASYITQHASYSRQFPLDYVEFLRHLREIYPDAHIVCIYGMMGTATSVNNGIKAALKEVDDAKITYKTFSKNTLGANSHPGGAAHVGYADQLTDYIQELLG